MKTKHAVKQINKLRYQIETCGASIYYLKLFLFEHISKRKLLKVLMHNDLNAIDRKELLDIYIDTLVETTVYE